MLSALKNLALYKETWQTSTAHDGVSSRAADGSTDGIYDQLVTPIAAWQDHSH